MDLGIRGRQALVCAASKGLGKAVAMALAHEGVRLVINARDAVTLAASAREIEQATGADIRMVAADATSAEGRAALLEACPAPDILITNAGGPPPGEFQEFEREDWLRAIEANMLSPILLIKATLPRMLERGFGRIINITSGAVKSPASYPQLGLSLAARGGLTGVMGALSRQTVRHNVTINNLLPGRFDTDRLHQTLDYDARTRGTSKAAVIDELLSTIPAGRFGRAEELGATCAFLCGAHAGFITGQNLVLDGGAFPGLL